MSVVTIERKVLAKNDEVATTNRTFLESRGIASINLLSSPGSGKTSILECTIASLKNVINIAVIEGDVQTDLDAQRVAKFGIPAVQIITRGGCHLEAALIRDAVSRLDLDGTNNSTRLLVIENVGNLVCPANYDLGESLKVAVISTTEGDDKPLKYPSLFANASVLIVNKIDLTPYLPCNIETLEHNARAINPSLRIFRTSCVTGEGIPAWCDWLKEFSS